MANRRDLILGIAILALVPVLFTVFYFWGYLTNLTTVIEEMIVGVLLAMSTTGAALIYSALKSRNSPVLNLTPLPHYKGYMMPPEWVILDIGQDSKGQTLHEGHLKPSPNSHPDARMLEPSQKLEVYSGPPNGPQKELIVKFGVIRVHCISSEAIDCRVEAKIKLIEQFWRPYSSEWRSVGCLNWYSLPLKRELQKTFFDGEEKQKGLGLNRYLKNTTESLHQNESKDLLLFYMIKDIPNVFMCTDVETVEAGLTVEGKPLKFQVELALTAEKYPKTTFTYLVTAKWDDWHIQST